MEDVEKKNPITEGNLWQALITFFIPIFSSSIIQQSYTIIDAIIVGRYAGKGALASVDATYVVIKFLINVVISVAAGGSVILAKYCGAEDNLSMRKTVTTLTFFSIFGGIIITLVGVSFTPMFVKIMRVPEDIFIRSVGYLRVYFAGSLFSLAFNIYSGVLRAVGDSKRPFKYMIISSAVNVVLDIIFVAVLRLDVSGAALATVISQGISAFLMIRYITSVQEPYALRMEKKSFDFEFLKLILKTGVPMGVQTILFAISNMYMQGAINSFGTDCVAAWAICGKMDIIIWIIADTMGLAVVTFVAQNFGAKKYDRMGEAVKNAFILTTFLIGSISAILYFFNPTFAKFFNDDGTVLNFAKLFMTQIAPFYVIHTVGETLSGAIRGRGESFMPMVLTLIGICLSRVVWIKLVLPLKNEIFTVLWGYPLSWLLTAVLYSSYYIYFMKKNRI